MKTITAITWGPDRVYQRIEVPWSEKGKQPQQENTPLQLAPEGSETRISVESDETTD